MNKIKLIALDLDGTALTPQNKVAETTTDAVRRAREAGYMLLFRPAASAARRVILRSIWTQTI